MTERVRAGVVGTGHLGALHAAKYAEMAAATAAGSATGSATGTSAGTSVGTSAGTSVGTSAGTSVGTSVDVAAGTAASGATTVLVGVYDADPAKAAAVAAASGCRAFASAAELLAEVDCASIAASTAAHRELAGEAIARGVHVLVEKPLASSLDDARALVVAAEAANVLLQVGHLERFNPAFADLPAIVGHPRFIECHRLAPFAGRGADTDVVFDVMIHDLDLISFVVGRAPVSVEAIGVPVLSTHADIANARIRFEGGCIANVTASRVSLKRERRLRIFQEDAYVAVDFDSRSLRIVRRRAGAGPVDLSNPMEAIEVEERSFADDADPLRDQIRAFVASVRAHRGGRPLPSKSAVAVSGREALVALEIAERVRDAVAKEAAAGQRP